MLKVMNAIFLIEGPGKAFDLIKQFIEERMAVIERNKALCDELGVVKVTTNRTNGTLTGVVFPGRIHQDFKKADSRGVSRPKAKTEWAKRFSDQVGHSDEEALISKQLNVPLTLAYSGALGSGWRCIGHPFNAVGFLYMTTHGPYAMYMPDVEAYCQEIERDGYTVENRPGASTMQFDGCRRIHKEEWEIMVLQYKLKDRQSGAQHEPV